MPLGDDLLQPMMDPMVKRKVPILDEDDIEADEDFERRQKASCGPCVSVHHGRVYFLHQTMQDFLFDSD